MATEGIGRMPVVDPADAGRMVDVITRSNLLKARLHHAREEGEREARLRP